MILQLMLKQMGKFLKARASIEDAYIGKSIANVLAKYETSHCLEQMHIYLLIIGPPC